jgi:F0F1-type ATP synthase membrane subunit c/vacuolar-type H+-ATPase subunit K
MSNNRDSNYISVGRWMWIMFVTAIPILGLIMMIVWAFSGENESRKNYFRAIFAWLLIFTALGVGLAMLGSLPGIEREMHSWTHR